MKRTSTAALGLLLGSGLLLLDFLLLDFESLLLGWSKLMSKLLNGVTEQLMGCNWCS
tara:strand:- start:119 stop:289 length:171 start_codon:yes stop_codon:yes gene_type:complete